jgi:hypothetical protein
MQVAIGHKCGHKVDRNLTNAAGNEPGPKSLAKSVAYWSERECTACWRSGKEVETQAVAERHALPQLQGSEKQVAWATKIRLQSIQKMEQAMADSGFQLKQLDQLHEGTVLGKLYNPATNANDVALFDPKQSPVEIYETLVGRKLATICRVLEAKFWIDTRDYDGSHLLGTSQNQTADDDGRVVLNSRATPRTVLSHGRYITVGGTKVYKNEMTLASQ